MELQTKLRFGLALVVAGALMISCDDSSADGGNGSEIKLESLSTPDPNTAVVVLSESWDPDDTEGNSVLKGAEAVYTVSSAGITNGELVFHNSAGYGNGHVWFKFSDVTTAGTVATNGNTVDFKWNSPGGQTFPVQGNCDLTITSPYTGNSGSSFTGQTECIVSSAGFTFTVYVKFDKTEP